MDPRREMDPSARRWLIVSRTISLEIRCRTRGLVESVVPADPSLVCIGTVVEVLGDEVDPEGAARIGGDAGVTASIGDVTRSGARVAATIFCAGVGWRDDCRGGPLIRP